MLCLAARLAFSGEVDLLRSVLQSRVSKLSSTLEACVKAGDNSLQRLIDEGSGGKPAAAWRNDELQSVQILSAAGAPLPEDERTQLSTSLGAAVGAVNWSFLLESDTAEEVAKMVSVLTTLGVACLGMPADTTLVPPEVATALDAGAEEAAAHAAEARAARKADMIAQMLEFGLTESQATRAVDAVGAAS
eukprot:SAG22_NODE_7770_length_710_cov_0.708674_1_plen_189_part_10